MHYPACTLLLPDLFSYMESNTWFVGVSSFTFVLEPLLFSSRRLDFEQFLGSLEPAARKFHASQHHTHEASQGLQALSFCCHGDFTYPGTCTSDCSSAPRSTCRPLSASASRSALGFLLGAALGMNHTSQILHCTFSFCLARLYLPVRPSPSNILLGLRDPLTTTHQETSSHGGLGLRLPVHGETAIFYSNEIPCAFDQSLPLHSVLGWHFLMGVDPKTCSALHAFSNTCLWLRELALSGGLLRWCPQTAAHTWLNSCLTPRTSLQSQQQQLKVLFWKMNFMVFTAHPGPDLTWQCIRILCLSPFTQFSTRPCFCLFLVQAPLL